MSVTYRRCRRSIGIWRAAADHGPPWRDQIDVLLAPEPIQDVIDFLAPSLGTSPSEFAQHKARSLGIAKTMINDREVHDGGRVLLANDVLCDEPILHCNQRMHSVQERYRVISEHGGDIRISASTFNRPPLVSPIDERAHARPNVASRLFHETKRSLPFEHREYLHCKDAHVDGKLRSRLPELNVNYVNELASTAIPRQVVSGKAERPQKAIQMGGELSTCHGYRS